MTLEEELLEVAVRAARAAGRLIVDERPPGLRGGPGVDTKSSATDMVTVMDRASEALIRRIIAEARPDDAVVGEEEGAAAGTSGIEWWVDPIDGTTNYVYDHPGYAVSVAAARAGSPESLVGVVVVPSLGEEFRAIAGGGAFRNGERLTVPPPPPPAEALLATGFGYDGDRRGNQGRAVARLLPAIRDIRRMGAAAVDLCSVACGRIDGYFEAGLSRWDLAAGALIAAEAGALVTAMDGGPVRPGSVLAAHPGLHAGLLPLLADSGAAGLAPD